MSVMTDITPPIIQFEADVGKAIAAELRGDEDEEPKIDVDEEEVRAALDGGLKRARNVFQRGYDDLKGKGLKEEVGYE
jgi:hypothetical protein